ncbi:MAG: sigma-70 family RNA polymerase sigma factor [Gelidibacter sp.]
MQPLLDSDIVLWQKLKQGDTEALGCLYDRFIEELFSYGTQFSRDKQSIMDAIHDLFFNLYKYRKNLTNTENVKCYLLRSLKNQILKDSKTKSIFVPSSLIPESFDYKNRTVSHEEILIETENLDQKSHQLADAVEILSKKQRLGIFLRFNENRKYEEIAEIMNVSVETSRTIIYRAIKVLRGSLTTIALLHYIFL